MTDSGKAKAVFLVLVLLGAVAIVDFGQSYAENNRITAMAVSDLAVSDTLSESETRTYTISGKDYEVTADFVSKSGAKFSVNGDVTPLIAKGGGFGSSDGLEIRVVDVQVQDFAGGVRTVTFSLSTLISLPLVVVITPGWNMISSQALDGLRLQHKDSCAADDIYKTVYSYNAEKSSYDTCELTSDLSYPCFLGTEKAAWLYNFGGFCSTRSISLGVVDGYDISLKKGWNMLSVLSNFEGKKVSNIIGKACKFGGGWEYQGSYWDPITSDTLLRQGLVGKGVWAYMNNDCSFTVH